MKIAEDLGRRRGRMELLLQELANLPAGYPAEETETALARTLAARLLEVYEAAAPAPEEAAPEEAAPEPAKAPPKGKAAK